MSSLTDALLAKLKPRIIGSPITRVVAMAAERLPAPRIAARGGDVGDLLVGLALFVLTTVLWASPGAGVGITHDADLHGLPVGIR